MVDFSALRDKLQQHTERLAALELHLSKAATLLAELVENDAMDSLPAETYDPFQLMERAARRSQDGYSTDDLEIMYDWEIAPKLVDMKRYDCTRYYPSVARMLDTLSERVGAHAWELGQYGPNKADIFIDALEARQCASLPTYVRFVDAAIRAQHRRDDYDWYGLGNEDFCIPAVAMACIASVALPGNVIYEAKQVHSARKST